MRLVIRRVAELQRAWARHDGVSLCRLGLAIEGKVLTGKGQLLNMSLALRIANLSWRDRLLLAEAILCLAVASLLIALLSFATLGRIATGGRKVRAPAPAALAHRVAWALNACGDRVPWKAVCFQRALAAQIMMRWRGFAAV